MDDLLCAVSALVGLTLMGYATRLLVKSNQAKSWPTVAGRVLESRLREVWNG
jgi:hypothetical protein